MDSSVYEPEYLGITEAAEYLRVSASTLRRWEKKGFLIPERTPTGIRRYTRQQLDDVLNSPNTNSYAISPTMDTEYSLENSSPETVVEAEHPAYDYYSNNTSNLLPASDSEMRIASHRYIPIEEKSEPQPEFENIVVQEPEDHIVVQSRLSDLVQNGLESTEFLDNLYKESIQQLPNVPVLDNYLARPLAIDQSNIHFENAALYAPPDAPPSIPTNIQYHQEATTEYEIPEEVTENINVTSRRSSLGTSMKPLLVYLVVLLCFVGLAAGAWLVYSNVISGTKSELIRPVM